MTALAVFVEGQTELIFVEQLLFKMMGYQHLRVVLEFQHGDNFHQLGVRGAPEEDARHTVLLSNCASDGKVLPAIEERALLLRNAQYDRVLGLRDIHPEPSAELEEIYELTNERLAALPLPCEMIIAVREVEAWFIADHAHFPKVDATLTAAFILERLGIDVETQDVEAIPHPTGQLQDIYGLIARRYDKTIHDVNSLVNVLNYDYLYLEAPQKVSSLKKFVDALDGAL